MYQIAPVKTDRHLWPAVWRISLDFCDNLHLPLTRVENRDLSLEHPPTRHRRRYFTEGSGSEIDAFKCVAQTDQDADIVGRGLTCVPDDRSEYEKIIIPYLVFEYRLHFGLYRRPWGGVCKPKVEAELRPR